MNTDNKNPSPTQPNISRPYDAWVKPCALILLSGISFIVSSYTLGIIYPYQVSSIFLLSKSPSLFLIIACLSTLGIFFALVQIFYKQTIENLLRYIQTILLFFASLVVILVASFLFYDLSKNYHTCLNNGGEKIQTIHKSYKYQSLNSAGRTSRSFVHNRANVYGFVVCEDKEGQAVYFAAKMTDIGNTYKNIKTSENLIHELNLLIDKEHGPFTNDSNTKKILNYISQLEK